MSAARAGPGRPPGSDLRWVPGGTFVMGSDDHYPEEAPAHQATVEGFWMDRHPVTNAEFRRFVEATGYRTVAEQVPDPAQYPGALPELLVPGSLVFVQPAGPVDLGDIRNWWRLVPGASWRQPQGGADPLGGAEDHPVVHVAYADADAYARWAGRALPTEAEWEFAARGGLTGTVYAWGDKLAPERQWMANTWQGEFPWQNFGKDGYERTSPVGTYPPNAYDLVDLIGNVWEWTSDWYGAGHAEVTAVACCAVRDPGGRREQDSYDPAQPAVRIPRKVLKGGSHLCAANYCRRYRPPARHPQPVDTSTSHVGFRCVVRTPT